MAENSENNIKKKKNIEDQENVDDVEDDIEEERDEDEFESLYDDTLDFDTTDHDDEFFEQQSEFVVRAKENLKKYTFDQLVDMQARRMEVEAMQTTVIGNLGLGVYKSFGRIEEVKVLDDKKLLANIQGRVKQYAILHEPVTCYMNMRNYWIVGGMTQKIKFWIVMFWIKILGMYHMGYLKFNLYVFRADGEYTLDPSTDNTPTLLQRKTEEFLKLENVATNAKVLGNMLADLKDPDPWWKTGQWLITILLIVAMFLFVLNGGSI